MIATLQAQESWRNSRAFVTLGSPALQWGDKRPSGEEEPPRGRTYKLPSESCRGQIRTLISNIFSHVTVQAQCQ